MDQELVAYLDRQFSELKSEITGELRAEIAASGEAIKSDLRAEIAASAAETRRHFDVVADRLKDKIQLVGEGVIGVDQKVDRFRGEAPTNSAGSTGGCSGWKRASSARRHLRHDQPVVGPRLERLPEV